MFFYYNSALQKSWSWPRFAIHSSAWIPERTFSGWEFGIGFFGSLPGVLIYLKLIFCVLNCYIYFSTIILIFSRSARCEKKAPWLSRRNQNGLLAINWQTLAADHIFSRKVLTVHAVLNITAFCTLRRCLPSGKILPAVSSSSFGTSRSPKLHQLPINSSYRANRQLDPSLLYALGRSKQNSVKQKCDSLEMYFSTRYIN